MLDIPRGYSPVMSDDSGRNSREETTGSNRRQEFDSARRIRNNRLRGGKENTATKKPSPTVIPATIDRDLHPSKRPPKREVGQCGSRIVRTLSDRERLARMPTWKWMTCLSCGARWSRKTGPGRHSGKDGADNRSTSTDTSLPRMCIDDATPTDDKQNGDVLRMQSVLLVQKSGIHISYYGITCFTVCALMFSGSACGGSR